MRIRLSNLLSDALLIAGGIAAIALLRREQRRQRRQLSAARASGQPRRRIAIVGVGFAGLAALNHLGALLGDDSATEVLLIDRKNYHLFTPLLYQVATGGVEPSSLTYPARRLTQEHGFRFEEATVQSVDVERKCLNTDAGPIHFDSLILAPGSVPNFFGMAAAEENSLPLKWVEDSAKIRNRVINAFELADREPAPDHRSALLTFVIVGGGATGVELAASLSDMIFTTLLPNYPTITTDEVKLEIIEARDTLLPGWNPRLGSIAAEHLSDHRVQLRLGTTVSHVTDHDVQLSSGEHIPTASVVWTAGVRAEPSVASLPGEKGRDGRIMVDQNLELPGHPGIFVIGDAAAVVLPPATRPLPPVARAAIEEGSTAAENALRRLNGMELKAFHYRSPGDLVSLGRGAAAADIYGVIFDGLAGWLVRRAVYLTYLVGFRNRLLVALQWAFVSLHERTISSFAKINLPQFAAAPPTRIRARAARPRAAAPATGEEERKAG